MKLGKYLHYKGHEYEVIGVASDSENLEELVVYRALYDSEGFPVGSLWVRKKRNFEEMVECNGKMVPRFKFLGA